MDSGDKGDLSVTGFLRWQSCHVNANIRLMIFNYVLVVYLLKIGVRYNDVELIQSL